MTVFQQFRLWARRAPAGQRAAALVAAALAVTLIAWLLIPPSHPRTHVAVTNGPTAQPSSTPDATGSPPEPSAAAESAGASGIGGSGSSAAGAAVAPPRGAAVTASASNTGVVSGAPASNAKVASGSNTPATSSAASTSCVSPPGSDQGVSASEIKIAVIAYEIVGPAGNDTFGLPPASTMKTWVQEVATNINGNGGVACRKLVPVFFTADPADPSSLQQTCLDVIQSQPFFVIDLGAYTTKQQLAACYPQAHIGFLSTAGLPASQQKQLYPYDFGPYLMETLYSDAVFGLQQRGFFSASNGFTKLGIVYRDCFPEFEPEVQGWLNRAGVPSSQIVAYNVGCPAAYASPSDLQAAILMFKQQGANSLMFVNDPSDFANFTIVAQQQGFTPRYGLADHATVATSYGSNHPDYQNLANAVAVSTYGYGEERTPGFPPSSGTQKCNAIYSAAGQPPVYQQKAGYGGIACNMMWFVRAAIEHAPALTRSNMAAGIQAAGAVDFSFPWGPYNFSGAGTTTGGQVWRVDQFLPSCQCWQVVDRTWHSTLS